MTKYQILVPNQQNWFTAVKHFQRTHHIYHRKIKSKYFMKVYMVLVLNLQLMHWCLHAIQSTYQRWNTWPTSTFARSLWWKLNRTNLWWLSKKVKTYIFASMSCTSKQAKIAEEFKRSQSKSNLWFRLRSGRITASKFYDACKTKPT